MDYLGQQAPSSIHSSDSNGSGEQPLLVFPTKPKATGLPAPVKIQTNFYPFKVNLGGRNVIFEYQVKTTPNLTCHTNQEKETLKRLMRDKDLTKELDSVFDKWIYFEGYVYSFEKVDDSSFSSRQIQMEEISYDLTILYHQELDFNHKSASLYFRAFINQLIRTTGFKQIRGGKHFNPYEPLQLEGVNMHSAFFNTMKCINGQIYLNLNPSIKFFQQE